MRAGDREQGEWRSHYLLRVLGRRTEAIIAAAKKQEEFHDEERHQLQDYREIVQTAGDPAKWKSCPNCGGQPNGMLLDLARRLADERTALKLKVRELEKVASDDRGTLHSPDSEEE